MMRLRELMVELSTEKVVLFKCGGMNMAKRPGHYPIRHKQRGTSTQ